MLVRIGVNKYLSRQSRWLPECFTHTGWSQDGRKILSLKGQYKRSLWDWFAGRRRVPVSVAEQMLREGMITQYIPVEGLDMVLIKCPATTYCVYMDYQPT